MSSSKTPNELEFHGIYDADRAQMPKSLWKSAGRFITKLLESPAELYPASDNLGILAGQSGIAGKAYAHEIVRAESAEALGISGAKALREAVNAARLERASETRLGHVASLETTEAIPEIYQID